jgi:outer membrane protein TolC
MCANKMALGGVQQKAPVGSRTVLDLLETAQAPLTSQVNLVNSQG